MTFKIVVLSLMLGIWGLDARSQNEEPVKWKELRTGVVNYFAIGKDLSLI